MSASASAAELQISSFTYTTPKLNGTNEAFSVSATNNGDAAINARLRVFLPANFTFSSAPAGCQFENAPHTFDSGNNPNPGATYSGLRMLYCDYASVTNSQVITLDFTGTATTVGVADMRADFWSPGADDFDGNNSSDKQITVNTGFDLALQSTPIIVSKSGVQLAPPSGTATSGGSTLSVTAKTKNNGPDTATSAVVQVTLPTPASNFGSVAVPTGTPWNCVNASNTVTCTYTGAGITSGNNFPDIAITGQLASNISGSVPFGVSITANASDPVTGNNGPTSVSINVLLPTDLAATKSLRAHGAITSIVAHGGAAVYRIGITNNGPNAAAAGLASVSDTLGAGWVIGAMPAGCSLASRTVTCTNSGSLASSASLTFDIPVTAPASGSCPDNTATVALGAAMADTVSGNDTTAPLACTWVPANADIAASKQLRVGGSSVTDVAYGQSAVFRIGIANSAGAPVIIANGAQVVDTFDAAWNVGAAPAGCSKSGQQVTCTNPSALAAGQSVSFDIPVTASSSGAGATNHAVVSLLPLSGLTDGNAGNDDAALTYTFSEPLVDISATKQFLFSGNVVSSVGYLQSAYFRIGIRNSNSSQVAVPALGASVTDSIDSDWSIGTLPAGCTADAGNDHLITCVNQAPIAINGSVTFDIPVTAPNVDDACSGGFNSSNVVLLALNMTDPTPGNDATSVSCAAVTPNADIYVSNKTKTRTLGGGQLLADGENITNTITVYNRSSSNAFATGTITVTDALGVDEAYVSNSSAANWSCSSDAGSPETVTCTHNAPVGGYAPNAQLPTLTLITRANLTTPGAYALSNTACAGRAADAGYTLDATGADCRSASINTSKVAATVALSKAATTVGGVATTLESTEDTLTYTVTASVSGLSGGAAIPTLTISDPIPAALYGTFASLGNTSTGVSASVVGAGVGEGCVVSGASVTCTLKNVSDATSRDIQVNVSRPMQSGAGIQNTATVSSLDAFISGSLSANATVTVEPRTEINVSKSANPTSSRTGANILFTNQVNIDGPDGAANLKLLDAFDPARFTYVAGSASITPNPNGATCAVVTMNEFTGDTDFDGINGLQCDLGSINPDTIGTRKTLTVQYTAKAKYPYPDAFNAIYTNKVRVKTDTHEANTANNKATVNVTVQPPSLDLTITKTDLADPLDWDDASPPTLNYRITATNSNSSISTANSVQVLDIPSPPAGFTMTFAGASLSGGTHSPSGGVTCTPTPAVGVTQYVTCNFADLPPNRTVIIDMDYTLASTSGSMSRATAFNNIAKICAAEGGASAASEAGDIASCTPGGTNYDTLQSNNRIVEATTLLPKTDLTVFFKQAVAAGTTTPIAQIQINEVFDYVLKVRNKGPAAAFLAQLTDTLPSGFRIAGAITVTPGSGVTLSNGNSCTGAVGASSLSCGLGALPVDLSADGAEDTTKLVTITIPVKADPAVFTGPYASNIANTACAVPADDPDNPARKVSRDPTAGNNCSSGNIQVPVYARLSGKVFRGTVLSGSPVDGVGIASVAISITGTSGLANGVTRSTTTAADGTYSFNDLPPGTWTLTETQPANYYDGRTFVGTGTVGTPGGTSKAARGVASAGADTVTTITLINNEVASNYNFEEYAPATVSGSIWHDANNDGVKGGGETTGFAAAQLRISGVDYLGNALALADYTTLSNGIYFFNVPPTDQPGGYTVTERVEPAATLDGKDYDGGAVIANSAGHAPGDDSINVVAVAPGTTYGNRNFGELLAASLSGYAYLDVNGNAVKNAGETTGIAAVQVTLSGSDDLGPITPVATSTSGAGAYSFSGLRPGSYTVTETQPGGMFNTGAQAGTAGGNGTATIANITPQRVSAITLASSNALIDYNFGHNGTTSLAGFVYVDLNNNGQKDAGERGIPGVAVTLSGTAAAGGSVCGYTNATFTSCTATSDSNGAYAFTGIPGSDGTGYTLTERTAGGASSAILSSYGDGADSAGSISGATRGSPASPSTLDAISGIVINTGESGANYLFGERDAVISGRVYLDKDDNGGFDGADTGINGVTVVLSGPTASGPDVCAVIGAGNCTKVTQGNGDYSFNGLPAGTYVVTETQPVDYVDRTNTPGSPSNGTAGVNSLSAISVSAGANLSGYLFGEKGGAISGFVYLDLNNDGVKLGGGEIGIAGVTLTLSGTTASGTSVCALTNCITTTASDGGYRFGSLPHANGAGYTITETQPGYQDGKETAGSQGGTVDNSSFTDNAAQNRISAIPFNTASDSTGNNFGEIGNGRISGIVFWDVNSNGLRETADVLLPGVTITLTGIDTVGDPIGPLTTTTAANGTWAFTLLRPGTYTVTETQPLDYAEGTNTVGTGTGTPGVSGGNSQFTGIVISGVDRADGYLFGEITNSLSGYAYVDANNDGAKDVGEPPLSGVTISLTGTTASGVAVSQTTTTAVDGGYSFSSVKNGTYSVTETQPAGYLDGRETAGSQGGTVDNAGFTNNAAQNRISAITFNAASASTGNNFGERATIDLSLTKSASNLAPQVGGNVTFTVNVANAGPSNASGVVVSDALPAGYTYVSSTASQGTYVSGTGLWTLGSIAKDASATLTVTATVKASGPYTNMAEVTAANEIDTDSTPNNHDGNEDDQKMVTPAPGALIDLSLTKAASNLAPQVGGNVTFTVSANNAGPSNATGVVVSDPLPAGYTFVSATPSQGSYVSGTGLWAVGSIAKDATATLSIVATVKASGPYANTAEVTAANETDSDSTPNNHDGNEDDQKTVTPAPSALIDLSLSKTASNLAPQVGSNVTFTVNVANAGPSNASGVVVSDALPAGYTYVSSTVSQGAYVSGTGLWTLGSIAKDASATLTVTATVKASGPYANTAEVTAATETDSDSTPNNHDGNEDDQKTVTPVPSALIDLSLTKSASNMAPSVGSNVTFTVSVANAGPSNASGVVVSDALPAGYTYVSSTVSQGAYVSGTGLWTVGGIAKDASATLSIVVTVKAAGSYTNRAEVTAANETDVDSTPNNHLDSEDDQQTITPTTAPLIDLSLTKSASNLAPQVGSNVTFTVSVANAGPSNASGVVVSDALPAGYTYVSSTVSQGAYVSGTGLWTLGSIAKDASATLTVTATVKASGPYANTAEVTAATETDSDSTPNNQLASEDDQKTVTPVPSALIDLFLNKTASNLAPQVGGNVTFTVSVANAGPSNASGVVVSDALPAGYTYVSSTVSQGAYVSGTGLWTLGSIAKDATATLSIVATVKASGPYANTAEVTAANETDSDSTPNNHDGNEDDQKTVTPAPGALIDLSLNKTASNLAPQVGSNVTFTVNVANAGPSNASGVVVSDALPAGYTYVSSTVSQGAYVSGTGLWTLGSIAKDATATLSIVATVKASGPYANTAEVTAATETDSDSIPNNHDGNEDDQKTVTPVPSALIDLSLSKTASNLAPQVGSNVTFTVSVGNAGPSNASGVVVSDALPAGYTYVSSTVSQGAYVSGTGLWTVGSIAKDAVATLTVTATVKASGPYANTAEVTSANEIDTDSTPNNHDGNEDDQKTVTPVPSALIDLSLNKTASNMAPQVGGNITFTVSVANAGPSNATGVQVTDLLPAGYTYVSSTVSQGGYVSGTGLWTLGSIAKDASATLTVTATVNASGPYANTAEVTAATETDSDSTPNNQLASEDDQKTVTPVPSALIDLSLNKTASNLVPQVGSNVTFTVSVGNAGPSNASGVVVSDALPAGYTYVSSTVSQGAYVSGTGLWTLGSIAKDASATLTVTATVKASGPYANTAEVTAANETDSDSTPNNHDGNEDDQKTVNPVPSALIDLSLSKTASNLAPQVGSNVTFTVNVANAGPSNASGVVVSDALPAGYTYVSSTVSQGGYVSGTGLWTVGNIAKDASATLTVTATVKASGPYANTAEVTAATETDSDSTPNNHDGNEDDQKTVAPVPSALIDLALNKTASNLAPQVGSDVTFTVSVANAGPSNASGVVVSDALPAGYTYVSSTVSQGAYVSGTGLWTLGSIAKDASATLTVTATVKASGPYANTAEVTAANEIDTDSTPNNHDGNEDDQKTVTPVPMASLSGKVYLDRNDNGTVDAGEIGFPGVTIKLTGVNDLGDTVDISVQTDADGLFSFADLRPSDSNGYTLTETQPSGYLDGRESIGVVGGGISGTAPNAAFDDIPANNRITGIQLGAGQSGADYLFGERGARLNGYVYVDANGNGGKDPGETGLSGIPVTLSGITTDAVNICTLLGAAACTVTTGADGAYAFEGLPTGAYTLVEDQTVVNLIKGADDKPLYSDGKESAGVAGGELVNDFFGSQIEYNRIRNINLTQMLITSLNGDVSGYLFGEVPRAANPLVLKPPIVNGYVWLDRDHSRQRPVDGSMEGLSGWSVGLFQSQTLLCTVSTDDRGFYQFDNLHCPGHESGLPISSSPGDFSISFSKASNRLANVPISGGGVGEAKQGEIIGITLRDGDEVTEQNLPLDPSGIVYDAVTRQPVAGATVRIDYLGVGSFDPANHLLGGTASQVQVTGVDGLYAFFLQNAYPSGEYRLTVTAPAGYLNATSVMIPVCAGIIDALVLPTPLLIQGSNVPPLAGTPLHNPASCPASSSGFTTAAPWAGGQETTQYYFRFNISNGVSAHVLNNHIPVDPVQGGNIVMTKTTPLINVSRGDLVPYTITARNTLPGALAAIDIQDLIPPGFKYKLGSASFDDDCDGPLAATALEPGISGRTLVWANLAFTAQSATPDKTPECKRIKLILVVGGGVGEGEYSNQTWSMNSVANVQISNTAVATVRVVPDPTFDCTDIIGKVFDDQNANGYQDDGEPGIPNVRVATARGLLVSTDKDGRFHVACAVIPQAQRGSNFIMKLDERTLPSGYRMTTENPRDVRATRGKLVKLNFGAAIHRVVRVELTNAAFLAGKAEPTAALAKAIERLPKSLRVKPSIVRLAYRKTSEENGLIADRLREVRERLEKLWKAQGCCYTLGFEDEVFERAAGKQRGAK